MLDKNQIEELNLIINSFLDFLDEISENYPIYIKRTA